MITLEKVYAVEFMQYTNALNDTVSDGNREIGKTKYLDVGRGPFLVKESELEKYRIFGGGYRSTQFVGMISV